MPHFIFDPTLLAFTAVVAVLTITPGADTMLVIRNVLRRGAPAGSFTAIGIGCGLFIHATLSAVGLSLLLVRSATAFEVVKTTGAAYLVFLGLRSIIQAWRIRNLQRIEKIRSESEVVERGVPIPSAECRRSVVEGYFTNLLNPKVAVFYLAFLPQFIRPGDPALAKSLFLAAIHCLLGLIWFTLIAFTIGRAREWLSRPGVRAGLEGLSGVILVGFGLRLALERR